jgi:hypothetical protein
MGHRFLALMLSAGSLVTFAPRVEAQASAPDPDAILESAVTGMAASVKRQAQRDPLTRSSLTLPEPQFTLETTRGKGRATGTLGLVSTSAAGEMTYGLSVSSPIGDAEDAEARPVDLRGLGNGAKVSVSVTGSRLFKAFKARQVRELCTRLGVATVDCTAGKLETANPAASQALLDLAFLSVPILYGGSFSYGRDSFVFFDAAGARQQPVSHTSTQAEGSLGLLVNRRRDLLAVHLAYVDGYTASSTKTQLCRPLADSTVTRCDPATIGAPSHDKSLVTTVEYRWQKRGLGGLPFALAPTVQWAAGFDGADDLTSVEVPFYVFQEKPKDTAAAPKLNGGLSTGWRSDTGFQAGVFIGATFSLFKL